MRVVLFTSEEPLYLPVYLRPILERHAAKIDRVVVAPFQAPPLQQLRTQLGMFGVRAGSRMAGRYLRGQLLDALPGQLGWRLTGRPHSVGAVCQRFGVSVEHVADVSDPAFVDRIQAAAPDLLLSIVAGQRLPADLLDAARDAINIHGSLLPSYRGRATAFWPLYNGDDRTGVTAHRMTEQFDAGPILEQRVVPIEPADTLDSVYRALASAGSELALDLLAQYPDLPAETPNETTPSDYHGLPGPDERREFRQRGNEFY